MVSYENICIVLVIEKKFALIIHANFLKNHLYEYNLIFSDNQVKKLYFNNINIVLHIFKYLLS